MKKHKVLGQFLTELLIVTCISILIGTIIGSIVSVPTANYMLKSQIEAEQSAQDEISQNFGGGMQGPGGNSQNNGNSQGGRGNMLAAFGNNSNVDYIDQMNAVIDAKIILQLALIGILLTIISGSVSMIFISRYTPLKILSSRT
ncbi:FtsX-like permease family protein [compost metagenome]